MTTSGFLLIDKPSGITSFDAIRMLRRTLHMKKFGHGGTLDPFASGLLFVAVGEGTKMLPEIILDPKEYVADIIFGKISTTGDRDGELSSAGKKRAVEEKALREILPEFVGTSIEKPPQFSALKIRGMRACDRVRKGEDISREMEGKKRERTIYSITIEHFSQEKAVLRVVCSSGTYIRSLAEEIGEKMESGAYVHELRRTRMGIFDLESAKHPEECDESDIEEFLPRHLFFPAYELNDREWEKIVHGNKIPYPGPEERGKITLCLNHLIAGIGEIISDGMQKEIHPRKVFSLS